MEEFRYKTRLYEKVCILLKHGKIVIFRSRYTLGKTLNERKFIQV